MIGCLTETPFDSSDQFYFLQYELFVGGGPCLIALGMTPHFRRACSEFRKDFHVIARFNMLSNILPEE